MTYRYRLEYVPDDNGSVLVTSPDIPLATFGGTRAEAEAQAIDAAHALLASMMDAKEKIPHAAPSGDGPRLILPLQTELKLRLYEALRSEGLTRADLQRMLGWQRESVDRLFRLDHKSKLDQIEQAFKALGKLVEVSVSVAA